MTTTTPAEQAARAIADTVDFNPWDIGGVSKNKLIAAILAYGAEREAAGMRRAIEIAKAELIANAAPDSLDESFNSATQDVINALESAAKENCDG